MTEHALTIARKEETSAQLWQRAFVPQNIAEATGLVERIVKSGMVPQRYLGKPEMAIAAVIVGTEAGLGMMTSLRWVAMIRGTPSLYGDGFLAVILAHPLCGGVHETIEGEGDDMVATCSIVRKGFDKPIVRTFSVADAKRAKLWGGQGPWSQYSQRMLAMRARGFAGRDSFADSLCGLKIAEEIADTVGDYTVLEAMHDEIEAESRVETEPEIVATDDLTSRGVKWSLRIAAAQSVVELAEVSADMAGSGIKKTDPPLRAQLAKEYTARLAELNRSIDEAPDLPDENGELPAGTIDIGQL